MKLPSGSLRLSTFEHLSRLLIKYVPFKPEAYDRAQKLHAYDKHVPAFYASLTPLLQLTTGGYNFHGGYFTTGLESWHQAQLALTRLLGDACGFSARQCILDVGCGVGGPAITMARAYGCRVHGLNITRTQIRRARQLVDNNSLINQIYFTHGDALNMPFRFAQFHHAYAIEALSHMPDKGRVFREVARVTLPMARFGILDACVEDVTALTRHPDYNRFNIGWGVRSNEWIRSKEIPRAFARQGFRMLLDRDISAQVEPSAAVQAEFARQRKRHIIALYGQEIYDIILRTMEISERFVREGLISYRLWIGEKAPGTRQTDLRPAAEGF